MIILNIIYHISGLFGVLAILVWTINLFMTTMILIQDLHNIWIRIIQVLSLFFLLYIIFLNINIFYDSLYKLAFIIPLSINKITLFEDIIEEDQNSIFFIRDPSITFLFDRNIDNGVNYFLDNLDYNKTYIVTFDLIFDWLSSELGDPSIILSKPI